MSVEALGAGRAAAATHGASPLALGRGPGRLTRRTRPAGLGAVLGSGGALLVVVQLVASVGNVAFHAVASRALGPGSYGALSALLVLVLAFSVPVGAVQAALCRVIVLRQGERGRTTARSMLARVAVLAVLAGGGLAAAAPLMSDLIGLSSTTPAVLLGVFVAVAIIGLVPRAQLLAQSRFGAVAAGTMTGVGVRLALGGVLLANGGGVTSAIVASVIGEACSTMLLLVADRHGLSRAGASVSVPFRESAGATMAFAGFWLLAGIDVIVASRVFSGLEAGTYAAAATAARAVLFAPLALSLVAFPRFAERDGPALETTAWVMAGLTLLLGLVGTAGLIAFSGPIVATLFGSEFHVAPSLLVPLGLGSCALALANLAVQLGVARGAPRSGPLWAGVGALWGLAALWHNSTATVAWLFLAVTVTVAAVMVAHAATLLRTPRTTPRADRWLAPRGSAELDLTIVVPYYNPGPRVRDHTIALVDALRREQVRFEVIAVSDGSTDGSELSLASLGLPELRCLTLTSNCGKGEALRVGFAHGRGQYLGFIDADGDLAPSLWHPFLKLMQLYEADIVLGSKRHPLSEVTYPPLRRVYSWVFQQLVRMLFHLRVRDTQTGIKLIRREVLAVVLPRMRERRFAFDLELFVVARRCGWRRFLEAPVRIEHHFTSTISPRSVVRMVVDMLVIAFRLHVLRRYDRGPNAAPADEVAAPAVAAVEAVA